MFFVALHVKISKNKFVNIFKILEDLMMNILEEISYLMDIFKIFGSSFGLFC